MRAMCLPPLLLLGTAAMPSVLAFTPATVPSCRSSVGSIRTRTMTTTLISPIPRMSSQDDEEDYFSRLKKLEEELDDRDIPDDGRGGLDDDAISRLISKRSDIWATDDEEEQKDSLTGETIPEDLTDLQNVALPDEEIPEDFDFENWNPEIKTKRPELDWMDSSSGGDDDADSAAGSSSSSPKVVVDYTSDYDDENDLHIPNRIGFSTVGWGDAKRGFTGQGKLTKKMKKRGVFNRKELQETYNSLLNGGVSFLETSESYGSKSRPSDLSSEHILGRFVEENDSFAPLIASTFANPWISILQRSAGLRLGGRAVLKALKNSCSRMQVSNVELYQIESTLLYPGGRGALADGLAMALDQGYCNYVGVKNMKAGGMKTFSRRLEKRGCFLASNQFEFSLTNRKALKSGLIDACKDLGVIPFVRNPLDGGLASGVYTAMNPSGGKAGGQAKFDFKKLEKLQQLHNVMESVAERAKVRVQREARSAQERSRRYGPGPKINTDITTTQVAINYVIANGAVPLPTVNTAEEAEEVLGCLGWSLTDEEVQMLDNAALLCDL